MPVCVFVCFYHGKGMGSKAARGVRGARSSGRNLHALLAAPVARPRERRQVGILHPDIQVFLPNMYTSSKKKKKKITNISKASNTGQKKITQKKHAEYLVFYICKYEY